jgi:hypothetical protein
MGKNLKLGAAEPKAYLVGPGATQWVPMLTAGPYQLTVQLPGGLRAGTYQLLAHNGTGGPYGWSEPVQVEVIAAPSQGKLGVFHVDQFGAKPNAGQDDGPAIQRAIDAAVKAGGGTVRFSAGIYHLGRTLNLPDVSGGGIHLIGAGMGDYDGKTQTTSGRGTVLRYLPGGPVPKCLLHVGCRFSSVCELTLLGGHAGVARAIHDPKAHRQMVARITQHDVTLQRLRLVMLDLRPDVPWEKRQDLQIYDPALHVVAPGRANLLVQDCEFHSAGAGIEIGEFLRGHMEGETKADAFPAPSTDYVRIDHCLFRGYARGVYKAPPSNNWEHLGCWSEGVSVLNGKYVIVQGCDFAGADRRGGKMMNRSILVYNSSIHDVFIADNRSRDVGMVCPRTDRCVNQGEQICFHFCYPHGGYFDVLGADPTHVTLNPHDPRNRGSMTAPHIISDRGTSRIIEEVGTNDHWIVFVGSGKGVGQYRVVVGADRQPNRTVLKLDRPWRVVPDRTSRATLTVAYRQNIVANNLIDGGFIDPRSKVAGILFWYDAFENIIAGNTLRNISQGIGFNSSFRNPTGWNLVRDNVVEQMGGMSCESAKPSFYFNTCGSAGGPTGPLFQPGSDVAGWYAVGNAARHNQGRQAPTAAYVCAGVDDASARQLPEQDAAGIMMPVVEHNRFTDVTQGIVINRAAVWPVIRENVVETSSPQTPPIFDQSAPSKAASP